MDESTTQPTEPTEGSAPEVLPAAEPGPNDRSRGALIAGYSGSITIRQRPDGLPHEGHDPSVRELTELLERAIGGEWDVVANVTLTRTDR